jgi:hypothetical protein
MNQQVAMAIILIGFAYCALIVGIIIDRVQDRTIFLRHCAILTAIMDSDLAGREGTEAVHIIITDEPDNVVKSLIKSAQKRGFKAETLKDQSTGEIRLCLSDTTPGAA